MFGWNQPKKTVLDQRSCQVVCWALCAFCCLYTGHAAFAANWYVGLSNASDTTGHGTTASAPFATVGYAEAKCSPGDTVNIASGTYYVGVNGIQITKSGNATQGPITIQATSQPVYLKGSQVITATWTSNGNNSASPAAAVFSIPWTTYNSQQVIVNGTQFHQAGSYSCCAFCGTSAAPGVLPLPQYASQTTMPSGWFTISNLNATTHAPTSTSRLYIALPSGQTPSSAGTIEASISNNVISANDQNYITLKGLTLMYNNGTYNGGNSGLLFIGSNLNDGGSQHWDAENCAFNGGDFGGFESNGDHHTFRHCKFNGNGLSGLSNNAQDSLMTNQLQRPAQGTLVEYCEFAGNNYRNFADGWANAGMKNIPYCRGWIVRHCYAHDNNGAGLWFDTCLGNIDIEDNLCVNNRGAGIMYEISSPSTDGQDPYGALIRNNRVLGNLYQGIYISASNNAIVEGNTCNGNQIDISLHGMPRTDGTTVETLQNNHVFNNIVQGSPNNGTINVFAGANASNNTIDGDYFVTPDGYDFEAFGVDTGSGGNNYYNIGQMQGNPYGFEQHMAYGTPASIYYDPSHANFNYNQTAGSPAVGKGWYPAAVGHRIAILSPTSGCYWDASALVQCHSSTAIGTMQQFDTVDAGNGFVALRSVGLSTNYYMCVNPADNTVDVQNVAGSATTIGNAQLFQWNDLGGGNFALYAKPNGSYTGGYLFDNTGNADYLGAFSGSPVGAAIFQWVDCGQSPLSTMIVGHRIALLSPAMASYLGAPAYEQAYNFLTLGTPEQYDVYSAGGSNIALKCVSNGYFLATDSTTGSSTPYSNASTLSLGTPETQTWNMLTDNRFTLYSVTDGFNWCANTGNNGYVATGYNDTIGTQSTFRWIDLGLHP